MNGLAGLCYLCYRDFEIVSLKMVILQVVDRNAFAYIKRATFFATRAHAYYAVHAYWISRLCFMLSCRRDRMAFLPLLFSSIV
jgi:hypothetical protein